MTQKRTFMSDAAREEDASSEYTGTVTMSEQSHRGDKGTSGQNREEECGDCIRYTDNTMSKQSGRS